MKLATCHSSPIKKLGNFFCFTFAPEKRSEEQRVIKKRIVLFSYHIPSYEHSLALLFTFTFKMKEDITQKALNYFLQYGFKTFTMDDLANSLGISKKTLYEQFASKNELVEAALDYALEMSCHQVDKFVSGEGSVIENVFRNQKEVQNLFNLNSTKPIWELKKYFPKTYERMDIEFTKSDALFIDKLLEKGWEEGLFREDINVSFYKVFYTNVQRMRTFSDTFDEKEFPFWDTVYTIMEYFFRIIVNEKGLQELEKTLKKIKEQ